MKPKRPLHIDRKNSSRYLFNARIMSLLLTLDQQGPIYLQIYKAIRQSITTGSLKKTHALPSTRELAQQLAVSRLTVTHAFDQLKSEGYIQSVPGSGTFVIFEPESLQKCIVASEVAAITRSTKSLSQFAKQIHDHFEDPFSSLLKALPVPYDFIYGVPDAGQLPWKIWQKLVNQCLQKASTRMLVYQPPGGLKKLREAIASYVQQTRGVKCDPEQIIITNGAHQAFDIITRVLVNANENVILEEPHYPILRNILNAAQAKIIAVPVDDDGICTDKVYKLKQPCKVIFLSPSHQFPTGVVLSLQRRQEIIAWAQKNNVYIVEDDYDGEFYYEGIRV